MTDLRSALRAGGSRLRGGELATHLTGNTLYGSEQAVSYYASGSVRLTLYEGAKYCTFWTLAATGDLLVQSLRTYRREVYRVVACAGPGDGFAPDSGQISLFRIDESHMITLHHAIGNHFGLTIDDANWVEL